jgi:hypothetical protein
MRSHAAAHIAAAAPYQSYNLCCDAEVKLAPHSFVAHIPQLRNESVPSGVAMSELSNGTKKHNAKTLETIPLNIFVKFLCSQQPEIRQVPFKQIQLLENTL